MNWKCPACGNQENLDESLRCTCDHEIAAEELEKYRVAPGTIEIYSQENKLGQGTKEFNFIIISLQTLSLLGYIAFAFFAPDRISEIGMFLCLFFLMSFVVVESIVKKQVSIRFYVIKKVEVPSAYNTFLFIFIVMGLAFFGKFVHELLK